MTPSAQTIADNASSRVDYSIAGMTCAACVRRVERAATNVEGVQSASVNLATERATVSFNELSPERLESVRQAIERAGYPARALTHAAFEHATLNDLDSTEPTTGRELASLKRSTLWAFALALPIFIVSMGPMLVPGGMDWMMTWMTMDQWNMLLWLLATPVQFGPGWRFYRHAYASLRSASPDMNLLVALGSTAAYAYSTVVTWFPSSLPIQARHVYFESSAVVIAFVLLGKTLESISKGRTRDVLNSLVKLQPRTAHRVSGNAVEVVAIEKLQVGDLIEIHSGESIPIDGTVELGESFVDESLVTGEPIPVSKAPGEPVIGGTVNQHGLLRVRVTAIGSSTFLSRIATMVQDAQANKPPIQHMVDGVVAWFAPVILVIAAVTAVTWWWMGGESRIAMALVHSVSVLIVACPCAMGLATPISMMVGTGRGAELGILFRSGESLQQLESVRRIVLDKTGTLTLGRPDVEAIESLGSYSDHELHRMAASASRTSQHPISQAIVTAWSSDENLLGANDSKTVPGSGIECTLDNGRLLRIGSLTWMKRLGIASPSETQRIEQWLKKGKSIACIGIDERLEGVIAVSDPIKSESAAALARLHELGLECWILSGDNTATVRGLAKALDLDGYEAEMLPETKENRIREWQRNGIAIAFVGDGINDAPALAAAEVGIAIGTGTEVAVSAADVVLISGHLYGIPNAILLARALMRNIRQNLLWAFGYNVLLIPIAAGALVPVTGWYLTPMMAAIAMSGSSLFVVFNALRLRWFTPTTGKEEVNYQLKSKRVAIRSDEVAP